MTSCPNCGTAVPDSYAFCGNCGTDMRPARTFQSSPTDKPETDPAGKTETKSTGQSSTEMITMANNPFNSSAYDYTPPAMTLSARRALIWIVVAAIALVCFCCGTAFGAVTLYWLEPLPPAAPVPAPTPEGLLLLALLLSV